MPFPIQNFTGNNNQFHDVQGDQAITYYTNNATVFDILEKHTALNALYNSSERASEHASTCQEGTRATVLQHISSWAKGYDDHPICWLEGPAGSGKSTVAHSIAKQCDDEKQLAVSFFFSRGKQDRSDVTKFFPTFAYQLASFEPALQTLMRSALGSKPTLLSLDLQVQCDELVVRLILSILEANPSTMSSAIIVIDGLDECGNERLVQDLIRLLIDSTQRLPFRFLFASRPEYFIRYIFESPSIRNKTLRLSLRDFGAEGDVRNYLQSHLAKIHEERQEMMPNVSRPWPTNEDLAVLVDKSEGLFIYVSTLVKFVGDGNGLPQQKLQDAMRAHKGVDPLYRQVLSGAQGSSHFEEVMGTIIYLRRPLTIHGIEQLLRLEPGSARLALHRCTSILVIPSADNKEYPRPYHASVREFLMDFSRAKEQYLDAKKYHTALLVNCLMLIGTKLKNGRDDGGHLSYACQNWCHHLSLALIHGANILGIESSLGTSLKTYMSAIQNELLKPWMYQLNDVDHLEAVCRDCDDVLKRNEMSGQWKSVVKRMKQIWNVVDNLNEASSNSLKARFILMNIQHI